jgi:hypothetical protein
MKKTFIIATLLLACFGKLEAQGFQNKRFSASYELGTSFLGRITVWDRYLLFRHTADINYALSKRFTVGLGVNHAKKTLPAGSEIWGLATTNRIVGLDYMDGNFHHAQVNDLTFSLNLKYYARKNGSKAPLGSYVGLMYEHGWQNTYTEYQSPNGDEFVSYDDTDRSTLSVISLTYGRNLIFNYKYLFGYGVTFGYNRTRELQFRRHIARPFVNFGILF